MSLGAWFRPPRHLIALFVLVTLVPSLLLMVFGWRLFQQDRELERRQVHVRREQAADLIVATLARELAAVEGALRGPDLTRVPATADSAVVIVSRGGAEAMPADRVLYYPAAAPGVEAPAGVFAAGEALEHGARDFRRAADWFAQLSQSTDAATRAGALVRLARNLKRIGAADAALDAYARAARIEGTAVGDVPAPLLARWARCAVLAELRRMPELRQEAADLRRLLLQARWRLTRPVFELHFADASRWAGESSTVAPVSTGIATAVDRVWQLRETTDGATAGRTVVAAGGQHFTVLWQRTPDRLVALIAGPDYARRTWLRQLEPLEQRDGVRTVLHVGAIAAASTPGIRRNTVETGLPWTLSIASTTRGDDGLAGRQIVWLAGLAMVGALVVAGTYLTGRAVSRELAVARLQSDFVAAVSHEFRTPLTSLRQLTEMLIDRPEGALEKRLAYYQALARQTERLHRLVESLLDFGRMEAGTSPYRLAPVSAAPLITDVVEQFSAESAARGHRVEVRITASGTVRLDRDAFTNALWNLLDNAVKYSPGCPAVWVDVACDADHLLVSVRDAGFGIPEAEQAEIFRKFVRGERAKNERISGTGIGLAMVHHIVTAHGGTVSVESEPGQGSTFTIRLPLAVMAVGEPQERAECLGS